MRSILGTGVVAWAVVVSLAGCGGKDICLGCDGSATPGPNTLVGVRGDIFQIQGSSALFEQVRVVFCVDFGGDFLDCQNTFTSSVDSSGRFSRSRITAGALRIGFRLDPNDDGVFDPTEPFAELQDPNGVLQNVPGGRTVEVLDVTIDFGSETATARQIRVTLTPTPTPSPAS